MDKVKVFFYGTLKRGGRWNSYYIQKNEGFVKEDKIRGNMLLDARSGNENWGYPIVVAGDGTVKGEVWNIKRGIYNEIAHMERGAGYYEAEVLTDSGERVKVFFIDLSDPRNQLYVKNFTVPAEEFKV